YRTSCNNQRQKGKFRFSLLRHTHTHTHTKHTIAQLTFLSDDNTPASCIDSDERKFFKLKLQNATPHSPSMKSLSTPNSPTCLTLSKNQFANQHRTLTDLQAANIAIYIKHNNN